MSPFALRAKYSSLAWLYRRRRLMAWLLLAACAASVAQAVEQPPAQLLHDRTVHLRSGDKPEWDEFAGKAPDGTNLVIQFQGRDNSRTATLLLEQDDVKLDWVVELNGKRLGTLFLMEAPLVHSMAVPQHLLRNGENKVVIRPPKENDDILIGRVWLDPAPPAEALAQCSLPVHVRDAESGTALPCRITILDARNHLAALAPVPDLAVRPGVAYTPNGQARLLLRPGEYTVYATRGFEYGLATAHVAVQPGENPSVDLMIRREVPTPGWVACDTHVHNFTYARHGDATMDERAITLAGEGIELPIATEHDCLVDYSGAACRTGVQQWFTPVIGDEVTTAKGHFNIFPVSINAPLPSNKITNWPQLMEVFRKTPGVQVVVLNHPRNIHNNFQPFASTNFDAATGYNLRGFEFTFDCIEVANSSALQSDWMVSLRDWFALLNYGYTFTAVGSSDVHDVSRYIVGQGRTYIACNDTDPAHINVDEACRSLLQHHALVSLGLLAEMQVNGRFNVGDLATNLPEQLEVSVRVLGPSWVKPTRLQLFANGIPIRDEKLRGPDTPGQPVDIRRSWLLDRPKHDVYLVALATGPGVTEPYWAIARPYQPSSPTWHAPILGATNPIWIDADGDGKFTSARAYAQRLLVETSGDSTKLQRELSDYDPAVTAQVAELQPSPSGQ